jgi:hypothetical protein
MVLHIVTPYGLVQVHHTGCVPQLVMTSFTEFHVPNFIGPDMATPSSWMHCTPNHFYAYRQRMKDCRNRKQWSNCHIVLYMTQTIRLNVMAVSGSKHGVGDHKVL